ncbi:MAG: ethanolamine ammonia-lyase reactivating factor EutA [Candidatus Thorarchaeota archaeon]
MIKTTEKRIQSVGIDVGTSTSHLIFSELVLRKDPTSRTEKFHVAERHIKFKGKIFLTPLISPTEIDFGELTKILLQEYARAGIKVSEIDTGAVIITGESAKKENAEKIIENLSRETGRFVAASAGPNFEAIISAYGSGAVEFSRSSGTRLIHTDVGGGTSNIAVIEAGEILATACINVGGRLIVVNENNEIVRLEPAGAQTLRHCKLDLGLGDVITEGEKDKIAKILAITLIQVLTSDISSSSLVNDLMMTPVLPESCFTPDIKWSFSGGVAEYIYRKSEASYNDLGLHLGRHIRNLAKKHQEILEMPEKIRATVIGASEYTLQISGSTTFISPNFEKTSRLPIRNLPIVIPRIDRTKLSEKYIADQIQKALTRLDISEGEEPLALAFHDPVRTVYDRLKVFSFGLVKALPRTIKHKMPMILIFDTDVGNSVGNVLSRETQIQTDILSIDEISLKEGDFIDIGQPVVENKVFPVVIKSLVFG